MAEKNFDAFKKTIEREFMHHPVVTNNAYTAWFATGEMTLDELRTFTVQFSVFSNQFLLAALNRVINADTLHSSHESKEILMNELGVIYNKKADGHAGADESPSVPASGLSRARLSACVCPRKRPNITRVKSKAAGLW